MDYLINNIVPMLQGSLTTLFLFFVVIVLSIPLGFLITLLAKCRIKPLAWIAHFYIYVLRGTPLLLQLLFIYFGLPRLPLIGEFLRFDRMFAAVLGFTLNYAAYFAEIFRGGLLAIDNGQYEAAKVLGFSKWQTLQKIILPQMFRVALPSVGNESITLVKDTSLLYAVSVPDLLHYASTAVSRNGDIFPFIFAAVIYLAMTLCLSLFFRWVENKLSIE